MEMEMAIKARLAALSRAQQLTRRGLIQQETEFSNHPTLKGLIHAIFAPYVAAGSNSPERIVVTCKASDRPLALVLAAMCPTPMKSPGAVVGRSAPSQLGRWEDKVELLPYRGQSGNKRSSASVGNTD